MNVKASCKNYFEKQFDRIFGTFHDNICCGVHRFLKKPTGLFKERLGNFQYFQIQLFKYWSFSWRYKNFKPAIKKPERLQAFSLFPLLLICNNFDCGHGPLFPSKASRLLHVFYGVPVEKLSEIPKKKTVAEYTSIMLRSVRLQLGCFKILQFSSLRSYKSLWRYVWELSV